MEEQPHAPELDFKNRHYEIDAPKEIFLPVAGGQAEDGDDWKEKYTGLQILRGILQKKNRYALTRSRRKTRNRNFGEYVICAHSNDGDFKVYPYGLSEKREQGITSLTGMRR